MSATDEIRAAVARLRDTEGVSGHQLDSDSRELLDMIRVLLRARQPRADWLDGTAAAAQHFLDRGQTELADEIAEGHPITIARAINTEAQPGHALGGLIADHLAGSKT